MFYKRMYFKQLLKHDLGNLCNYLGMYLQKQWELDSNKIKW